jgi:diguanylate cyclase (GGDEF)-like protein/PAS domain S-box-containing protein
MLMTLLRAMGAALDGIQIGFCAFDADDRTLVWNSTFLELFPEHAERVHAGEPYAENLRRYYASRLVGDERALIERYVASGVERHRAQRRPFEFEHRGQRLRVSSLEMGSFGRVRLWRKLGDVAGPPAPAPRPPPSFDHTASALLERIADGVLVVDAADRTLWANQAFLALYGLPSVEAAAGQRFEDLYRRAWDADARSNALRRSLETLRENQRFSGAPYELQLPDDRWVRVVEQRGDAVDGRGCFMHADITALKRQQQALIDAETRARDSEARYRLLAEYSSDVTVAVADGAIVYVSPAAFEMLGWQPGQIVGRTLAEFCHPDDLASVNEALRRLDGEPQADYRARVRHADGSHVWVESRARLSPVGLEPSPASRLLVLNVRCIAARKKVEDELERALVRLEEQAVTDALTGLANRRRFDEALAVEWRRAQRDVAPLSLLMVDIDHFKTLNDTHGHPAGDAVLARLGSVLASFGQRAGDLVARYGGEEFTLLLPNTALEHALVIAEKLRRSVARQQWGDIGLPADTAIRVSVGVCCADAGLLAGEGDALVRCADEALYAAKRAGRNRVVAWGAQLTM